ncbi:hypothetical protein ABH15_11350 [Methanoculleus taiwanensis]|uniref:FAS1 domain-containing protein n=1 Tax=Methanoculleus taiwanensis TaxID=1550565 RepID=A0A498GZT9_9EURY|nr:fasciclin domain-containing protein [Methanoculleus taiwanensis]RXE55350.1 hypothetical protein ABH15_11350 [Methanoculleus taiwanensis]
MRQIVWACVLLIIGMVAVTSAIPMGSENATMGNESNATGAPGNQTMGNQTGNMTLVDVIQQDPNLTTLSTALDAANLTGALQTGGPYTVFAPDNAAFEALGNETVGTLLSNQDQLTAVLQYHVVAGEYTPEQLMNMTQQQNQTDGGIFGFLSGLFGGGQNETQNQTGNMTGNGTTLQTLLGENITVTQENGQLVLNNDTYVVQDINTSTGVLYVIDKVLIPPNMTIGNMTGNQTMGNQTTDNITGNQTA